YPCSSGPRAAFLCPVPPAAGLPQIARPHERGGRQTLLRRSTGGTIHRLIGNVCQSGFVILATPSGVCQLTELQSLADWHHAVSAHAQEPKTCPVIRMNRAAPMLPASSVLVDFDAITKNRACEQACL